LDWLDQIKKLGFALIPDVFSPIEIDSLCDNLAHSKLRRTRAGIRHALGDPTVASVARDPRLMTIACQILGHGAFPFRGTLFHKSPATNWLVVWHQDTALPLLHRVEVPGWGPWSVKDGIAYAHAPASALRRVVALRVHLDDSTEQNGPLRVLPRTQNLDVLTDDAVHQLASEASPVACVVKRGGIVAMRPLLIHASSKSRSGDHRRALHIEYAASPIFDDGPQLAIT